MNAAERPICVHQTQELRRKVTSSGGELFGLQCTICGGKVGDWISKSKAVASGHVGAWDENLSDAFWRSQRSTTAQRDGADAAFLRKIEWYRHEYLHSAAWKIKREKVLERDRHTCQGCGGTVALDVHHRTYANIGDELLFQLITLCRGCHERVHEPTGGWPEYEAQKRAYLYTHPKATADEFEQAMLERARKLEL